MSSARSKSRIVAFSSPHHRRPNCPAIAPRRTGKDAKCWGTRGTRNAAQKRFHGQRARSRRPLKRTQNPQAGGSSPSHPFPQVRQGGNRPFSRFVHKLVPLKLAGRYLARAHEGPNQGPRPRSSLTFPRPCHIDRLGHSVRHGSGHVGRVAIDGRESCVYGTRSWQQSQGSACSASHR